MSPVIINKLFAELINLFPSFKAMWSTQEAFNETKRTWVLAFKDTGITTEQQIQWGIKKCRLQGGSFAPTAPQFIQWCKPVPEDLSLPSVDLAYKEAVMNAYQFAQDKKWAHDVVYDAYCAATREKLAKGDEKSEQLFHQCYLDSCKKFGIGEELRKPVPMLPKEKGTPSKESTAKYWLGQLYKMVS